MTGKDRLGSGLRARTLALLAATAIALSACTTAANTAASTPSQTSSSPAAAVLAQSSPQTAYDPSSEPIVQVVRRVTPAVMTVTSRTQSAGSVFTGSSTSEAVGTGFVVRSDGVILTNYHVVEDALGTTVTLPDGRTLAAHVLATDKEHDLAVLKIDARNLSTVTLGDSSKVVVGERVVAIGYALDLAGGPTVTSGIISSLQRTIEVQDSTGGPQTSTRTYHDVIQTDAALNSGNSGGPLVTLDGDVIGINAAGSSQAENVGFAVAIDAAKSLIQKVLT